MTLSSTSAMVRGEGRSVPRRFLADPDHAATRLPSSTAHCCGPDRHLDRATSARRRNAPRPCRTSSGRPCLGGGELRHGRGSEADRSRPDRASPDGRRPLRNHSGNEGRRCRMCRSPHCRGPRRTRAEDPASGTARNAVSALTRLCPSKMRAKEAPIGRLWLPPHQKPYLAVFSARESTPA